MESKLIISHGDIEGYKKISYYTKRFTKTITFYLEQNYRNVLEVKGIVYSFYAKVLYLMGF